MRKLTFGLIIFCVVCTASGQSWQDEEHVWNEEKGKWEVINKAGATVTNVEPSSHTAIKNRPFEGEPWEKYLSKNVKYGRRAPSEWELNEAKRKYSANEALKERGRQKAEERKQIIAYRRATGWYDERRNAGLYQGTGAYRMFVGYNQYRAPNRYHQSSCVAHRTSFYDTSVRSWK